MDFRASLTHQRGSALIFAVGLCTLVVILATSLILALHHDMRRFERLDNTVSHVASAHSAAVWAMDILSAEDIHSKVAQTWDVEMNGLTVHAMLIDMDGLFNLNTLMEDTSEDEYSAIAMVERLMASLGVNEQLVSVIRHHAIPLKWVSEVKTQLALPPEMYAALLPMVRANESSDRAMHVNTMPPVVLASVLSIEIDMAESLLAKGPFESQEQFHEALMQLSIPMSPDLSTWLKFNSQQYLVQVDLQRIGEKGVTQMYTLLRRTEDKWRVVYQSTGVRI